MSKLLKNMFLFITILLSLILQPIVAQAQNGDNNNSNDVKYLFIQTAKSGAIQKNKDDGNYTVTLNNVDPWVTYFSDVPHRVTGFMAMPAFIKLMQNAATAKDFKGLNTGFIAFTKDDDEKNIIRHVLTIREVKYIAASHKLTFKASIVPGSQTDTVPDKAKFQHTVVFIDSACLACVAGGF